MSSQLLLDIPGCMNSGAALANFSHCSASEVHVELLSGKVFKSSVASLLSETACWLWQPKLVVCWRQYTVHTTFKIAACLCLSSSYLEGHQMLPTRLYWSRTWVFSEENILHHQLTSYRVQKVRYLYLISPPSSSICISHRTGKVSLACCPDISTVDSCLCNMPAVKLPESSQ